MPIGNLPGVSELRGGAYGIGPTKACCHGSLKSKGVLLLARFATAAVLMEWEVGLWDVAVRRRVARSWYLTRGRALRGGEDVTLLVSPPQHLFTDSRVILRLGLSLRGAHWRGRGVGSRDQGGVRDVRPRARGRLWQLPSIARSAGLRGWSGRAAWCVHLQNTKNTTVRKVKLQLLSFPCKVLLYLLPYFIFYKTNQHKFRPPSGLTCLCKVCARPSLGERDCLLSHDGSLLRSSELQRDTSGDRRWRRSLDRPRSWLLVSRGPERSRPVNSQLYLNNPIWRCLMLCFSKVTAA